MKKCFMFTIAIAALLACQHTPPNGSGPNHRDSIGDPITPEDSVKRLDPDSVVDSPEVRF